MTSLMKWMACGSAHVRPFVTAAMLTALCAPVLVACVETGDFGRRKPSIFSGKSGFDPAPDRISAPATWTDDETELRNRSALYLNAPRLPLWPSFELWDDLTGATFDVYYGRLAGTQDASPVSRYHRLQADIAGDGEGIAPFRILACKVMAADRTRQTAAQIGDRAEGRLTERDYSDLLIRIGENTRLITQVEENIEARHKLYAASLARLRLSSPDAEEAARTETMLHDLARKIASPRPCRK